MIAVAADDSNAKKLEFSPGIRLLARLARVAEQCCQSTGISLPQYRMLVSISGTPQRARDLAARVGVSAPALTSLVAGLQQNGLLDREFVPTDRRGIQLVRTAAGSAAVVRAEAAIEERLRRLLGGENSDVVGGVVAAVHAALDREGEAQVGVGG